MTTEGNPVHQRKRGPGRCIICGETWTDRYVGAQVCGKQKCYYLRAKATGRTQASENKGE
jgi:hypothetical protein